MSVLDYAETKAHRSIPQTPRGQILRPYQVATVEAVLDAIDPVFGEGLTRVMYTLPTGAGKTTTFSEIIARLLENPEHRILVLAHRVELISQAYSRIRAHCHLTDRQIGQEIAEAHADPRCRVIVGSVQTCMRAGRPVKTWQPTVIISDECFVAGTMIGDRKIEELVPGDSIQSFNHESRRVERRTVTAVMRNRAGGRLVRFHLSNGRTFVCTENHPIWGLDLWACTWQMSYRPAIDFRGGDMVQCIMEVPNESHYDSMPRMRNASSTAGNEIRSGDDPQATRILLGRVQKGIRESQKLGDDGEDQSHLCIGSDEAEQPDAPRRQQRAHENNYPGYGVEAVRKGREWHRSDCPPATSGLPTRMGYGDSHQDGAAAEQRVSDLLQSGHRQPDSEDSSGSGRSQPQHLIAEGPGQEERRSLEVVRVDRVEVLEPGSDGTFGGVCPDGFVYNLEVEGNHNYFANGCLVHNCHHAAAKSYRNIATRYGVDDGRCIYIGCTATAKRTDKFSLHAEKPDGSAVMLEPKKGPPRPATYADSVFQRLVYDYTILDAIEEGWLVPITVYTVKTETSLDRVDTGIDGDFKIGELEEAVDNAERTIQVINAWVCDASNRPTLVFCAGVEHAHHAADLWRQAGYTAAAVDGETDKFTRAQIFRDYLAGRIQVLTNFGIATEGTDLPNCSCIVNLRPTKSWTLFCQMQGRGLRSLPGVLDGLEAAEPDARVAAIAGSKKASCAVIDVVDLYRKIGDICSAPAILDLPVKLDMQGHSLTEAKRMLDEFSEVKDRVIGECPATFTELQARLEQVSAMLGSGARSTDGWRATDNGYRYVGVPPECNVSLVRQGDTLRLLVDAFGRRVLDRVGKPGHDMKAYLDRAAHHAEEAIDRTRAAMPVAPRGTLQRLSEKQIRVLTINGHSKSEIDTWAYGKAKAMIGQYIEKWRARNGL